MAAIKVGFTGYGFSTNTFHAPFIFANPAYKVYAFLQRAAAPIDTAGVEAKQHCTVDYPDAKHYQSADEFFADPNIDLVVICTPLGTHYEFAERALRARKHGREIDAECLSVERRWLTKRAQLKSSSRSRSLLIRRRRTDSSPSQSRAARY